MKGVELLDEMRARILAKDGGAKSVTDGRLAKELGISVPTLMKIKAGDVTVKQAASLLEKFAAATKARTIEGAITPIIEFFALNHTLTKAGASYRIFDPSDAKNTYFQGLKQRLDSAYGIYIFYDSRGRALYVGKAEAQTLWREIHSAFNRARNPVQSIKIADHPWEKEYRPETEVRRKIVKRSVAIAELATYFSAYEIAAGMIGKFEATLIRAFANDLLNVRIENF